MTAGRGSRNANAALNEELVIRIRQMLRERDKWGHPVWTATQVSKDLKATRGLNISAESIRRVGSGATWGWLSDEPSLEDVQQARKVEVSPEMQEAARASAERIMAGLALPERNAYGTITRAGADDTREGLGDAEHGRRLMMERFGMDVTAPKKDGPTALELMAKDIKGTPEDLP